MPPLVSVDRIDSERNTTIALKSSLAELMSGFSAKARKSEGNEYDDVAPTPIQKRPQLTAGIPLQRKESVQESDSFIGMCVSAPVAAGQLSFDAALARAAAGESSTAERTVIEPVTTLDRLLKEMNENTDKPTKKMYNLMALYAHECALEAATEGASLASTGGSSSPPPSPSTTLVGTPLSSHSTLVGNADASSSSDILSDDNLAEFEAGFVQMPPRLVRPPRHSEDIVQRLKAKAAKHYNPRTDSRRLLRFFNIRLEEWVDYYVELADAPPSTATPVMARDVVRRPRGTPAEKKWRPLTHPTRRFIPSGPPTIAEEPEKKWTKILVCIKVVRNALKLRKRKNTALRATRSIYLD